MLVGVVTEENQKHLIDTEEISKNECVCPQGDITNAATERMEMNHEMRKVALEMNVVPGL